MKLKELMDIVFASGPIQYENCYDYRIMGNHLEALIPMLLKCDEFEDVTEIKIADAPIINIGNERNSKVYSTKTINIGVKDDFKLPGGLIYLYSLEFTPIMYDPKTLMEPIKDGCVITPTLYNVDTFTPYKRITLEFSPLDDEKCDIRRFLQEQIDKVLDNPKLYEPDGVKGIMVRGVYNL